MKLHIFSYKLIIDIRAVKEVQSVEKAEQNSMPRRCPAPHVKRAHFRNASYLTIFLS